MTLNPVAQTSPLRNVAPLNARIPQWTFADRLRKARQELRWEQEQMAEALGVKRVTYAAWETGRNKPDLAELVPTLEAITGITRIWFLGWEDTNGPHPDGGTVTRLYPGQHKSHNWGRKTPLAGGTVSSTTETGSDGYPVAA
jgi:transcriptional regulator with XRE-family HTH domain